MTSGARATTGALASVREVNESPRPNLLESETKVDPRCFRIVIEKAGGFALAQDPGWHSVNQRGCIAFTTKFRRCEDAADHRGAVGFGRKTGDRSDGAVIFQQPGRRQLVLDRRAGTGQILGVGI